LPFFVEVKLSLRYYDTNGTYYFDEVNNFLLYSGGDRLFTLCHH